MSASKFAWKKGIVGQAEVGAEQWASVLQVGQGTMSLPPAALSTSSCSAVTRSLLNFPAHENPYSLYFFPTISKSFAILLLFFWTVA